MNLHHHTTKAIDPVCGMEIDSSTATAKTCHGGIQIFFCAEGCRNAFLANPERYAPRKPKGAWGRFLDRMEKATGGKAMKCH